MNCHESSIWLDGLGAAVLGGVVAALTAVIVVRLTARNTLRQGLEAEVRAQAIRVMALGKEISTLTTTLAPQFRWSGRALDRRRRTALIEFQVAAFTLEGMLVPVNERLARRLQAASTEGDEVNHAWVRKVVNLVAEVYGVSLVGESGP